MCSCDPEQNFVYAFVFKKKQTTMDIQTSSWAYLDLFMPVASLNSVDPRGLGQNRRQEEALRQYRSKSSVISMGMTHVSLLEIYRI